MKLFRMILSIFLIVALLNTMVYAEMGTEDGVSLSDESNKGTEETIVSTYNIEDSFAEDTVLLVLKKAYSKDGKEYTAEDFGIECTEIKDITPFANGTIRQQIELIQETFETSTMDWNLNTQIDTMVQQKLLELEEELKLVNVEEHRRILKITLKNPGKENVLAAIGVLEKLPFVRSASPDLYCLPCAVETNDPYFENQWALDSIHLPECWEITTGYNKVKVGVIDTGIEFTHPEFENAIVDSKERDFYLQVTTDDYYGHGTKVSGVIGAATNNEIGIAAVNHNVELVPLKVAGSDGICLTSAIVNAIDYAESNNILVLNFSAGSYDPLPAIYDALSGYNGLFVCSAGNYMDHDNDSTTPVVSVDTDQITHYPSCYDLDRVISVGAYDQNNKWKYNWGKTSVDLAAPGYQIYTTSQTSYIYASGTSLAAPYVTAVASLIMSLPNNNFTPEQVKEFILDGTDPVSGFEDKCAAGGKLNAYRAVRNALEMGDSTTIAGDFDGDGVDELAAFYGRDVLTTLVYWQNLGNCFDIQQGNVACRMLEFRLDRIVGQVAAGDFDGDGVDEIGALYDYGDSVGLFVLDRQATGNFICRYVGRTGLFNDQALKNRVTAGDIDGDGIDEMLGLYNYSGVMGLWYFRQNMDMTFSYGLIGKTASLDPDCIDNRVAAGDFDGDGIDEVGILYDHKENYTEMMVLEKLGNGGFSYYTVGRTGEFTYEHIKGLVSAGDYDGDGIDEMMALYGYDLNGDTSDAWMRIWMFKRMSTGTLQLSYSPAYTQFYNPWIAGTMVTGKFDSATGRDKMAGIYQYPVGAKVWAFGYPAVNTWSCVPLA
ncbi:MAG: S8 family serine peptidase [Clostridia bacterium]|nr:S8 family serine peptidase [Clostridia bacterium]